MKEEELSDEIASLKMELRSRIEDLEKRVDALELAVGETEGDSRSSQSTGGGGKED